MGKRHKAKHGGPRDRLVRKNFLQPVKQAKWDELSTAMKLARRRKALANLERARVTPTLSLVLERAC